jgi:putative cell wall-binding protein
VSRISGPDRFATAASISASHFEPGVDIAYVATGASFPDALAGGPPAGLADGPVLLVAGDVPTATADELRRLQPARIVVLGGTAAVPAAIESALAAFTAGGVTRLAGSSRFDTAARIVDASFPSSVETVYVATGGNFPDALSGVPPAIAQGAPLLLVAGDVPAAAEAQILRLQPRRIVVLGGEAAVPAVVADALRALLGQPA